jgi:hypothetical protein
MQGVALSSEERRVGAVFGWGEELMHKNWKNNKN